MRCNYWIFVIPSIVYFTPYAEAQFNPNFPMMRAPTCTAAQHVGEEQLFAHTPTGDGFLFPGNTPPGRTDCAFAASQARSVADFEQLRADEICTAWGGAYVPVPQSVPPYRYLTRNGPYGPRLPLFDAQYSNSESCIQNGLNPELVEAQVKKLAFECCRPFAQTNDPKPSRDVMERAPYCDTINGPSVMDSMHNIEQWKQQSRVPQKFVGLSMQSCTNAKDNRDDIIDSYVDNLQTNICSTYEGGQAYHLKDQMYAACSYSPQTATLPGLYEAHESDDFMCCVPRSCIPIGGQMNPSRRSDALRGCCGSAVPSNANGLGTCHIPLANPAPPSPTIGPGRQLHN